MRNSARIVYVDSVRAGSVVERLDSAGFAVDHVETIQGCLERLSAADCVVGAHDLPDGTAVDLCRSVRSNRPSVPIVVYTDDGSEALAGAVVAAGADGYVPAASGPETLVSRVRAQLGSDRQPPTETARDRLELAVEQSPLAIIEWNLDFEAVSWNQAATDLFGYSATEATGERATDLIVRPGDRDDVVESWTALVEAGVHSHGVNRNVRKDGSELTCEWFNTPLVDDGEIVSVLSFVRDATDELQRADALETLQETTHDLMRARSMATVADVVMAATADVIDRAQAEIRYADGTGDRLELAATTGLAEPDVAPTIDSGSGVRWDVFEAGEPRIVEEPAAELTPYELDSVCGNVIVQPLGEHGLLTVGSAGEPSLGVTEIHLTHVLAATAEVALDRLTVEDQLRAERDRFAILFENVPDPVVSGRHVDGTLLVESVNPAFERIFGYRETELVGEPLDRFVVPPDRRDQAATINDRSERGRLVETEVKRRTTDGLRDFMLRVVPFEADDSDYAFGVYTDITEQKQRQKRVEVLNRVLRHDLRNGMNIIDGSAQLIASAVDDEELSAYAEVIQERTNELIELAEKTRAVERTLDRSGQATGPVDVVDGISAAIERLEAAHPEATVSCSVPDSAYARADDLLEEAIYHVLENAAEHNDTDTPEIEISIEEDEWHDETLVLSVADNGPGIPDEERELLEEDREITQLRHTSGLGLWLVDWVVTQSGGQLSFGANEPRGTVVRLQLPKETDTSPRTVSNEATAGD